jgi:UDP-glucuronate decarboxylase
MATRIRRSTSRTALVAGGAGFLGTYLCERLVEQDYNVICLDNFRTGSLENLRDLQRDPRFSLIEADVCQALPRRLRVDRIYNMACPASPPHYQADPVHTLLTSVVGTRNLLDVAAASGARLLQASTSEVYGDPEIHPQTEGYWGNVNPIGVRACYDEGKRAAETLCFDYLRSGRVDVRIARIFNTYGPRMRPDDGRIVSNLIVQALSGRPLTIYGSGEQTRSFCFVADLIDGLMRLMEVDPNPHTPINIGNPEEYSINELARMVSDMTCSRSPIVRRPLPLDDPRLRRPDISLATTLLGWSPRTSVRAGVAETIGWFASMRGETAPTGRKQVSNGYVLPVAAAAQEV